MMAKDLFSEVSSLRNRDADPASPGTDRLDIPDKGEGPHLELRGSLFDENWEGDVKERASDQISRKAHS